MKVLCVLSHHMSQNCVLNEESIARALLAIRTYKEEDCNLLVTTGWAYRQDCKTSIADAFMNFIKKKSEIPHNKIISDSNARDTVGDAYFLRCRLQTYVYSEICIVTSDYHVERTKIIFEKIFNRIAIVSVIGAETARRNDQKIIRHEKNSIRAFNRTFESIPFDSLSSIHRALASNHPFYNGKIYPKISDEYS